MIANCPACKSWLEFTPEMMGMLVACAHCGKRIRVKPPSVKPVSAETVRKARPIPKVAPPKEVTDESLDVLELAPEQPPTRRPRGAEPPPKAAPRRPRND